MRMAAFFVVWVTYRCPKILIVVEKIKQDGAYIQKPTCINRYKHNYKTHHLFLRVLDTHSLFSKPTGALIIHLSLFTTMPANTGQCPCDKLQIM